MVNDTVGTMMTCAYEEPTCEIGLIVGKCPEGRGHWLFLVCRDPAAQFLAGDSYLLVPFIYCSILEEGYRILFPTSHNAAAHQL